MSFMTEVMKNKKLFLLISHKHSTFNYIIEYESLTVGSQLPLDIYSSFYAHMYSDESSKTLYWGHLLMVSIKIEVFRPSDYF